MWNLYLSPDKNLVACGSTLDKTNKKNTMCVYKFNHQGDLIWKYVRDKTFDTLSIKNITFIDEHNMMLLGSNGQYKTYFAKINDEDQKVNENLKSNAISIDIISPNPAQDMVKALVKINNNFDDEISAELVNSLGVKVMNLTNKFVWNKANGEGTIEFSTENLPAGAYYLGVSSKKENDIEGIIIQK